MSADAIEPSGDIFEDLREATGVPALKRDATDGVGRHIMKSNTLAGSAPLYGWRSILRQG